MNTKTIKLLIILTFILFICGIIVEKAQAVNQNQWNPVTTDKYNTLVSIGMDKEVAKALITECKRTAKDANRCIKIGASILGAESTLGTKCTVSYNCFGMEDGATKYKSKSDGVKDWVKRYNKYWYNQKTPSSFYSNSKANPPVTRYCMGGSAGFCANGYKNAWATFNKLNSF